MSKCKLCTQRYDKIVGKTKNVAKKKINSKIMFLVVKLSLSVGYPILLSHVLELKNSQIFRYFILIPVINFNTDYYRLENHLQKLNLSVITKTNRILF